MSEDILDGIDFDDEPSTPITRQAPVKTKPVKAEPTQIIFEDVGLSTPTPQVKKTPPLKNKKNKKAKAIKQSKPEQVSLVPGHKKPLTVDDMLDEAFNAPDDIEPIVLEDKLVKALYGAPISARESSYSTPDKLSESIGMYFKICQVCYHVPALTELLSYLNLTHDTFLRKYLTDKDYSKYRVLVQLTLQRLGIQHEQALSSGAKSAAGGQFWLNKYMGFEGTARAMAKSDDGDESPDMINLSIKVSDGESEFKEVKKLPGI